MLATPPTKRWHASRWSWKLRSNLETRQVSQHEIPYNGGSFLKARQKQRYIQHICWNDCVYGWNTVCFICSQTGSCNLSCLRQRMEKQVKTYIKALKKSINQERFLIRVAGLEYEVAQKLPQAAPIQENCGPGWERDSGRCGKIGDLLYGALRHIRTMVIVTCNADITCNLSTLVVRCTFNVHFMKTSCTV